MMMGGQFHHASVKCKTLLILQGRVFWETFIWRNLSWKQIAHDPSLSLNNKLIIIIKLTDIKTRCWPSSDPPSPLPSPPPSPWASPFHHPNWKALATEPSPVLPPNSGTPSQVHPWLSHTPSVQVPPKNLPLHPSTHHRQYIPYQQCPVVVVVGVGVVVIIIIKKK